MRFGGSDATEEMLVEAAGTGEIERMDEPRENDEA
jgi:hypothetical protein